MAKIRPMLACKTPQEDALRFPLYASPKLDGVRCLIIDGQPLSRSLKPIRNQYVQDILSNPAFEGLDGELIVGPPTNHDVYRKTNSGVMSENGEPDFSFYVFDVWLLQDTSFLTRMDVLRELLEDYHEHPVKLHHQEIIYDLEELLNYEQEMLTKGYEGLILRSPEGFYKHGRSTPREQGMVKLKRFWDAEAEVIGFEEQMHNANQATINALGYQERSSHKENQEPMGVLGALICKTKEGIEFKIGTGFDQGQRVHYWQQRGSLIGQLVKYKFFPVGIKEKPRHPVFLGFRDADDL